MWPTIITKIESIWVQNRNQKEDTEKRNETKHQQQQLNKKKIEHTHERLAWQLFGQNT